MDRRRILIAEDNALVGELLELRLQGAGYETRLCPDGAEAAEAMLAYRPHVLIADIQLPGLNGLDLLGRVRQNPETARIPAIIMTAYRYGGEVERARALGAQAVVRKPFEFDDLLRQVSRLAAGWRPES